MDKTTQAAEDCPPIFNGPHDSAMVVNPPPRRQLRACAGGRGPLRAPIPLDRTLRANPAGDGLDHDGRRHDGILIMSLSPRISKRQKCSLPGCKRQRRRAQFPRPGRPRPSPLLRCVRTALSATACASSPMAEGPIGRRQHQHLPNRAAPWQPSPDSQTHRAASPRISLGRPRLPGAFAIDKEPILLGRISARIVSGQPPTFPSSSSRGERQGPPQALAAPPSCESGDSAPSPQTWIEINAHAPRRNVSAWTSSRFQRNPAWLSQDDRNGLAGLGAVAAWLMAVRTARRVPLLCAARPGPATRRHHPRRLLTHA